MNHTFKNENGHLTAQVQFDGEEVNKASHKAVNKLSQNVTVPGFRKGKAPVEAASKYLRNQDVADETIDELLRTLDNNFSKDAEFSGYIKDNKLEGSIRPKVSLEKFSNTEANFTVVYTLRPVITKLASYKGLTSKVVKKDVTDKDIEAELERLAKDNEELVNVDRAAKDGDTTNIDFVGLMDGKEFDGGSAKGFDLVLGSKHFVPGFEEQVIGHKAGEKFDVALTMPDNYPAPLTSKAVVFKVTLNAVKEASLPKIDDAFATTLTGDYVSKDLNELKSKIKAKLTKTSEDNYYRSRVNDYLVACRDASEFAIADEVIDSLAENKKHEDSASVEQQGLTMDQYLKLINKTEEDYTKEVKNSVLAELKSSLVYDAIAKAEKVAMPTQADVEVKLGSPINKFVNGFTSYLKSQKMNDEQIQAQINNYINQIFSNIVTERVQDIVIVLNGDKKPVAKKEEKPVADAKAEVKTEAKAENADEKKEAK
jgi:trigger factor